MKIGILAPVAWRTPPRHYGPWERVASLLAEGLVTRGHEVTLFATADSITRATLQSVVPHGYEEDRAMDGRVWEAMHVAHALDLSESFDVVHNHLDWLPLTFARSWRAPLVTTIHGFSGPRILPAYVAAASNYVSISDADRSPQLEYVATVHHGVDSAELAFRATPTDDLVVFGRIHPDKGTADAIEIARQAGRRLLICGIVQDEGYFRTRVAPHIDDDAVVYLGSVGPEERSRILGSASVLLHPIHFDEPFGLSVVEAMVTGTPVVAYRRGSMTEVVDDGITGFLADDPESAADAVARAAQLDRHVVRDVATCRFSVDRMVEEYVEVYKQLAG